VRNATKFRGLGSGLENRSAGRAATACAASLALPEPERSVGIRRVIEPLWAGRTPVRQPGADSEQVTATDYLPSVLKMTGRPDFGLPITTILELVESASFSVASMPFHSRNCDEMPVATIRLKSEIPLASIRFLSASCSSFWRTNFICSA